MRERLVKIPAVAVLLRVVERARLDAADQFAAAIGLFGFIALVPLILLAVAVAGYLYAGPADQRALAEGLARSVPGLGATLGGGEGISGFVEDVIDRRGALTVTGLVGVLVTALRPVNAGMTATLTVFRARLPKGVRLRSRQVVAGLLLVAVALAAVGTSTVIAFASLPTVVRVSVSFGATYALDVLLFWTAYTVLSPGARIRGRALLPGALAGAAGWTLLKVGGSVYVSAQVDSANALYGAVGGVVALLLLLYLGARLYLYGAELAAVRHERRHGPIPLPPGTSSLARIDEPLPDGSYVTAPGGVPRRRPGPAARGPRPATAAVTPPPGASGAVATAPDPVASADDTSVDPRKVAALAAGAAGLALVYGAMRGAERS